MGVPVSYNFRNLVERKATTLMTAVGIALTVAVLVGAVALVTGLSSVFAATGNPLQAMVLRKGGSAELSSVVTDSACQLIKQYPQVARNGDEVLASPELVTVINLPSVDHPSGMNVTVRGLGPVGLHMRDLSIFQGRWFTPGRREVVVGQSIAKRYPGASLGKKLRFGRGDWEVVGVFAGGESAVNSEIWCDLGQLAGDFDRQANWSSVLVRANNSADLDTLIDGIIHDRNLGATAMKEQDYYANMTSSGTPMEVLGLSVAVIMAIGSGFGAMNTMYAAVARRGREIGTLRSLGFSRKSILVSFMFESVLLSLAGGIIGCLIALPLNGLTTAVGSFQTFSEIAFNFRVGASAILAGLGFAAIIGGLGGFLPALAASRRDLLQSLREG
ncbi:MAG: ABC transporter permease [Tepidisphaeraceae bacterium]|jgi:putative ABC transport system permease protein